MFIFFFLCYFIFLNIEFLISFLLWPKKNLILFFLCPILPIIFLNLEFLIILLWPNLILFFLAMLYYYKVLLMNQNVPIFNSFSDLIIIHHSNQNYFLLFKFFFHHRNLIFLLSFV